MRAKESHLFKMKIKKKTRVFMMQITIYMKIIFEYKFFHRFQE